MFKDPSLYWQNFRLGTELQVSGSFIYNAIYTLDNMQTFYFEEECFEFLYNISVGLERLQKIVIILIEHDESQSKEDQEDLERSLITHNKSQLMDRIKSKRTLKLGTVHNKFLALLDNFYNSTRYDRFNLSSVYRVSQDKKGLIDFISEELGEHTVTDPFYSTPITIRIKKFVGRIIKTFTTQLYEIINNESTRLNIYANALTFNSKAFKIFIAKEFDFEDEKLMQKEVALFLLKSLKDDELNSLIGNLEPLDFGEAKNMLFESMLNYHKDRRVMDEMIFQYGENKSDYFYTKQDKTKYSRVDEVMAIGNKQKQL
jgi:hypothetical protein